MQRYNYLVMVFFIATLLAFTACGKDGSITVNECAVAFKDGIRYVVCPSKLKP